MSQGHNQLDGVPGIEISPESIEDAAAARVCLAAIVRESPSYMDMEDAARYLDTAGVDPWLIKIFSGMRHSLNEIAYWHKRTRP